MKSCSEEKDGSIRRSGKGNEILRGRGGDLYALRPRGKLGIEARKESPVVVKKLHGESHIGLCVWVEHAQDRGAPAGNV